MGEQHWKRIPAELEREVLQHIANEDEGDYPGLVGLLSSTARVSARLGQDMCGVIYTTLST